MACLFVVAAAVAFAGITQQAGLRAISIWAVALLVYAGGLVVWKVSRRLRPVGVALTGLGLALIPIAGSLLGALDLTSGRLSWFVSSLAGAACYVFAAWLLRSEIVTWFAALFSLSLVMSAVSLTTVPVVWYFVTLILASAVMALVGHFMSSRTRDKFVRPLLLVSEVVAPLAVFVAIASPPRPTSWGYAALFGALAVHYAAGALYRRSFWHPIIAQVAAIFALMSLTHALSQALLFAGDDQAAASFALAAAVGVLLSSVLCAQGGMLRSRSHYARACTVLSALALGVSALLATGAISSGDFPHWVTLLLSLSFALSAAASSFSMLRRDSPFSQGMAVTAGVLAVTWLITPLAHPEAAEWLGEGGLQAVTAGGFAVVLAGLVAVQSSIVSRAGRHLTALRRTTPIISAVGSLALLLPFFFVPQIGGPVLSGLLAFAVLLVLSGSAFVAKNALLLTGSVPLTFAVAFNVGDASGESAVNGVIPSVLVGLLSLIVASLITVEAALMADGRRWRARYSSITALLLAGMLAFSALSVPVVLAIAATPADAPAFGLAACALALVGVALLLARESQKRILAPHGLPAKLGTVALGITAVALLLSSVFLASQGSSPWGLISMLLMTATVFVSAFRERFDPLFAAAALPVFAGVWKIIGFFGTLGTALHVVLSAWFTWLVFFGLFWVLGAMHRRRLTALIVAFAATLVAIVCTPGLEAQVPWLRSLPQVATGVSVMIPAIMLATVARMITTGRVSRVLPEVATYIAALGAMAVISGIAEVHPVIRWHVILVAAWVWAELGSRRGEKAAPEVRRIASFAILTLLGVIAGLVEGSWYSVVFLVDHVALLVYGAVRSRPWALWWGLVASVAAIVWFLKDLVWLALIVLAVVLIAVVVWLLLKGQRSTGVEAGSDSPPPSGPPAPGSQGQPAPHHPLESPGANPTGPPRSLRSRPMGGPPPAESRLADPAVPGSQPTAPGPHPVAPGTYEGAPGTQPGVPGPYTGAPVTRRSAPPGYQGAQVTRQPAPSGHRIQPGQLTAAPGTHPGGQPGPSHAPPGATGPHPAAPGSQPGPRSAHPGTQPAAQPGARWFGGSTEADTSHRIPPGPPPPAGPHQPTYAAPPQPPQHPDWSHEMPPASPHRQPSPPRPSHTPDASRSQPGIGSGPPRASGAH